MSFITGQTKYYGDINVYLYRFASSEEIGDEWLLRTNIRESWVYKNFDLSRRYYYFPSSSDRSITYVHKTTKLQLTVPIVSKETFIDHCVDILTAFDLEYCKLALLGTTWSVMDLRGVKTGSRIFQCTFREQEYQRRLVNSQVPIPSLRVLAYFTLKSRE